MKRSVVCDFRHYKQNFKKEFFHAEEDKSLSKLVPNRPGTSSDWTSVDSNKSVDPQIKRASDKLSNNLRQSTDRITDKVEGMVDKAADKAERQFRRNLRGAERPAENLDEVIERTIFKDVGDALEAK